LSADTFAYEYTRRRFAVNERLAAAALRAASIKTA
jgi:hypothetical protein